MFVWSVEKRRTSGVSFQMIDDGNRRVAEGNGKFFAIFPFSSVLPLFLQTYNSVSGSVFWRGNSREMVGLTFRREVKPEEGLLSPVFSSAREQLSSFRILARFLQFRTVELQFVEPFDIFDLIQLWKCNIWEAEMYTVNFVEWIILVKLFPSTKFTSFSTRKSFLFCILARFDRFDVSIIWKRVIYN